MDVYELKSQFSGVMETASMKQEKESRTKIIAKKE